MNLGHGTNLWELESAEERHALTPEMFKLPPLEDRLSLTVGAQAELLFFFRGRDIHGPFVQSERLWVTVREVLPSGYVGELHARPVSTRALDAGEPVWFEPHHVAGIRPPGTPIF
jgi:hypothetical protein